MGIVLSQEDSGPKLWLITELMDENLKDIMHQLTVKHKIRAMIQVAKAMYVFVWQIKMITLFKAVFTSQGGTSHFT